VTIYICREAVHLKKVLGQFAVLIFNIIEDDTQVNFNLVTEDPPLTELSRIFVVKCQKHASIDREISFIIHVVERLATTITCEMDKLH
jgi:hypothetical protein